MTTNIVIETDIKQDINRYGGKWVAFLGSKIIAANDTLKELMQEIDAKGLRQNVSVFLVPRKDEGPYILIIL